MKKRIRKLNENYIPKKECRYWIYEKNAKFIEELAFKNSYTQGEVLDVIVAFVIEFQKELMEKIGGKKDDIKH